MATAKNRLSGLTIAKLGFADGETADAAAREVLDQARAKEEEDGRGGIASSHCTSPAHDRSIFSDRHKRMASTNRKRRLSFHNYLMDATDVQRRSRSRSRRQERI